MTSVFLGLDPASHLAAVASIDESARLRYAELRVPASWETFRRLTELRKQLREFLHEAADVGVHAAVIERPAAHHGGATLLASYGVLAECASSMLECVVWPVTPQDIDARVWQGRTRPRGDRKARNMLHARSLGYPGCSQDVADALVAADCARLLCEDIDRKAAA
jgi:hypothetical protein